MNSFGDTVKSFSEGFLTIGQGSIPLINPSICVMQFLAHPLRKTKRPVPVVGSLHVLRSTSPKTSAVSSVLFLPLEGQRHYLPLLFDANILSRSG